MEFDGAKGSKGFVWSHAGLPLGANIEMSRVES